MGLGARLVSRGDGQGQLWRRGERAECLLDLQAQGEKPRRACELLGPREASKCGTRGRGVGVSGTGRGHRPPQLSRDSRWGSSCKAGRR